MKTVTWTPWITAACAALAVGLSGCAPASLSTTPEASTPPATVAAPPTVEPTTESPTPTPEPSPTPTEPAAEELMPGTNHNHAAAEYAYPAEQVQGWLQDPSTAEEKVVFLTFDDGPNYSTTVEILDILREYQVPATFFVIGNLVADAPEVLQREIAEGHAVATHSYTHNYDKLYPGRHADAERVVSEFIDSRDAIRDVLGADFNTSCWRYPGGHMSWKSLSAADEGLAAEGVHWIDWNSMTGDAEPESRRPTTVDAMVRMATAPIDQGVNVSVMLAHDTGGKDLTVKSLPRVIEAYQDAGYRFGVIA